tara:strand:+ start:424 stop:2226 length:1803 start_codon:yes stop_codon:yes gene_type:complete
MDIYEMPWRPNYEGFAAAGWIGGAGLSLIAQQYAGLPPEPFWWSAGLSVGMATMHAPKAINLWKKKRSLAGTPLTFTKAEQLIKRVKGHEDEEWIGEGFDWGRKHAQMAFEILKRDRGDLLPPRDHSVMGSTWIHGLEQDRGDIFQKVEHLGLHRLILGTTGSGKTRCFDLLITQAVLRNQCVIILDPKGDHEMAANAKRACELAGAPERFAYFHPAFPEKSIRINPLRNFNRTTELATRIASLIGAESGTDPFQAYGQMSLNNLASGIVMIDELPTLVSLRHYLEGGPAALVIKAIRAYCEKVMKNWESDAREYTKNARGSEQIAEGLLRYYREVVQEIKPSSEIEGLLGMFEHDRTHFSKMVASLLPIMNMLTSKPLGALLSPDPMDIEDTRPIMDLSTIIKKGMVLYCGLDSLSDSMVGKALGTLLISDLASIAGDRYNFGVGERPVSLFCDEVAEMLVDQLIMLLNKSRGAGFSLSVASQSLGDLEAKLGSEAKARQVLGNINHLIALRTIDNQSQEYVIKNLPMTRLNYVMRTQGTNTEGGNPMAHTGNIGERLMEEEAEIFPSQLLGELPNLEYIAKLGGGRLVKGKIPILQSV